AWDLALNRKPDLGVLADPSAALVALAAEVGEGDGTGARARWAEWLAELKGPDAAREREIDEQAAEETDHVNPLFLCREIDRALSPDSVLVADGGDFVATASYTVSPRTPLSWLDPGVFGTLGVGAA